MPIHLCDACVSSDIRNWSGGDTKNWSTLSLLQ